MVRKMTFLFLGTILLSSLIIVCELTVLALGCAPARYAGASPRASGREAHRADALDSAVSSPLRPPSRKGPAEEGVGWTSAPAASALRIGLREVPVPGQLLERGGYSSSTGFLEPGSNAGDAGGTRRTGATVLLLGTVMLLTVLIVARDAGRIRPEVRAAAGRPRPSPRAPAPRAPSRTARPGYRPGLLQLALWLALVPAPARQAQHAPVVPALGDLFPRDPAADWMRCRLVPT